MDESSEIKRLRFINSEWAMKYHLLEVKYAELTKEFLALAEKSEEPVVGKKRAVKRRRKATD